MFLILEGLEDPPAGEAVLVVPWKSSLFNLWRRRRVEQRTVQVELLSG